VVTFRPDFASGIKGIDTDCLKGCLTSGSKYECIKQCAAEAFPNEPTPDPASGGRPPKMPDAGIVLKGEMEQKLLALMTKFVSCADQKGVPACLEQVDFEKLSYVRGMLDKGMRLLARSFEEECTEDRETCRNMLKELLQKLKPDADPDEAEKTLRDACKVAVFELQRFCEGDREECRQAAKAEMCKCKGIEEAECDISMGELEKEKQRGADKSLLEGIADCKAEADTEDDREACKRDMACAWVMSDDAAECKEKDITLGRERAAIVAVKEVLQRECGDDPAACKEKIIAMIKEATGMDADKAMKAFLDMTEQASLGSSRDEFEQCQRSDEEDCLERAMHKYKSGRQLGRGDTVTSDPNMQDRGERGAFKRRLITGIFEEDATACKESEDVHACMRGLAEKQDLGLDEENLERLQKKAGKKIAMSGFLACAKEDVDENDCVVALSDMLQDFGNRPDVEQTIQEVLGEKVFEALENCKDSTEGCVDAFDGAVQGVIEHRKMKRVMKIGAVKQLAEYIGGCVQETDGDTEKCDGQAKEKFCMATELVEGDGCDQRWEAIRERVERVLEAWREGKTISYRNKEELEVEMDHAANCDEAQTAAAEAVVQLAVGYAVSSQIPAKVRSHCAEKGDRRNTVVIVDLEDASEGVADAVQKTLEDEVGNNRRLAVSTFENILTSQAVEEEIDDTTMSPSPSGSPSPDGSMSPSPGAFSPSPAQACTNPVLVTQLQLQAIALKGYKVKRCASPLT